MLINAILSRTFAFFVLAFTGRFYMKLFVKPVYQSKNKISPKIATFLFNG
jgi:hypothetical protein